MAGYLVENNTYSPAISKVDAANDEANLQLANRTRYLNNALNDLTNYLGTLKDEQDVKIDELSQRINQIRAVIGDGSSHEISTSDDVVRAVQKLLNDVAELENTLKNHTHTYAGSSKPGGPAGEVSITEDQVNRLSMLGTDSSHLTNVKRNSRIYAEEGNLYAETFVGDLEGEASAAKTLSHSPNVKLTGDVLGSATLTGDKDLTLSTTLREQVNVSPGDYGELSNSTLSLDGSIIIPNITVNSSGVITKIQNRVVHLPNNLGTNNTISAQQDARKIYVIGADSQNRYASTYSQSGVYAKNNKLYSNNDEVVTLTERQELTNKTINGYELGEASEYSVDKTIGGTIGSDALITSDAVAKHTHNYAGSTESGGNAIGIDVSEIEDSEEYKLSLEKDNKLYSSSPYVKDEKLVAKALDATDDMYIPGGKIWIENLSPSDDSGGNMFPTDFLNPDDFIQRSTLEHVNTKNGCKEGQLLTYKSGGYQLATNVSRNYAKNLAIALEDSDEETKLAKVMIFGTYNLGETYFDGADAYVGKDGDIIYGKPMDKNIIVKKIGYVRNNYLIFMPFDDGCGEKLDELDSGLRHVLYPDHTNCVWEYDNLLNYTVKEEPLADSMWDLDEEGDVMPSTYCTYSDFWEMDEFMHVMPTQENIVEDTPSNP